MSTRALHEALELLQDECGGVCEVDTLYSDARAEVEAIEKAAAIVCAAAADLISSDRLEEYSAGMDVLRTLATQRNAGTAGASGPSAVGARGPQE